MGIFARLFGSKPATIRRATLQLDMLEAREVPSAAVLDLTHRGASGDIGGALFSQAQARPGAGAVRPFLALDADWHRAVEQGYNTGARRAPDDTDWATALKVADVPAVTIDGVRYREFRLDAHEGFRPQVSLDQLRLYVSDNPSISARLQGDALPGATLAYDMDATGNNWVKLDGRLSNFWRPTDMVLDVPEAALAGGKYVYLYSQFGAHIAANGGAEVWETQGKGGGPVAPPATGPTTLTGAITLDGKPVDDTLLTVTLVDLEGNPVDGVQVTHGNGTYTITGVPAGQYFAVATFDGTFPPASGQSDQVNVTGTDGTISGLDIHLVVLS